MSLINNRCIIFFFVIFFVECDEIIFIRVLIFLSMWSCIKLGVVYMWNCFDFGSKI